MRKYTTATGFIVLIPFVVFLFVLKGSSRNSDINSYNDDNTVQGRSSLLLSSRSSPNEIAQMIGSSSASPCKCDCDNSNVLLETTTSPTQSPLTDAPEYELENTNLITNPVVFVITPTYPRATQMADMTRLAQTLMLVKDIFWIVSEDAVVLTKQVADLLNRTSIPHVHLLGPRPKTHLDKRSGRGVSNRLRALKWLRDNYANSMQEGAIYFADDDNAYDMRVFEEMRHTKKVSVFPVGLLAQLGLSSPIISEKTGKVIGYHDPFIGGRNFAIDMAGFAVSLQFFLSKPKATMPYIVGYEEDYFIRSLGVTMDDLEPVANNCTQVLVWHTKTNVADSPTYVNLEKVKNFNDTNLPLLYHNLFT